MGIRVAGIDARTQEEERDIRHAEWEAQYDSKQQDLGGYEVHLARQERWALQSGHLDQKGGEGSQHLQGERGSQPGRGRMVMIPGTWPPEWPLLPRNEP